MSLGQKIYWQSILSAMFALFIYGYLVCLTHHWVTWGDLTWAFVWQAIKGLGFFSFFVLIAFLFATLSFFKQKETVYPEHKFFREWASVYCRPAKGGGRAPFFVEDVEEIKLQRSIFRKELVYLAKVKFKWKWLLVGRRTEVRLILRIPDETRLQPFLNWTETNLIKISFVPEELDHRRS